MGKFRSRTPQSQKVKGPSVRVNEEIRAPRVRVVDSEGGMLGIMSSREAYKIAQERRLDLVEIAPQADPPVCKIIDFGKFRYEQQKREKTQKKTQHRQQLKEIRFKAGTDTHDFEFKSRHAREFLLEGDKVKASVFFRGREIVHKDIGIELLQRFVQFLDDVAKVDQAIKMEGNQCVVLLAPDKAKITVVEKTERKSVVKKDTPAQPKPVKEGSAEKSTAEKPKAENVEISNDEEQDVF